MGKLGKLLKEHREHKGYTLAYMTEKLGMNTYQAYQRYEALGSLPVRVPMKRLPRLRELLNIPLGDFWEALAHDLDLLYPEEKE